MAKSKAEKVVIRLLDHTTNKFTEQDLQNQINLHGEYPEDPYKGWRRVYPELFGDKLPKGLRFVRFVRLVNFVGLVCLIGFVSLRQEATFHQFTRNVDVNVFLLIYEGFLIWSSHVFM